MKVLNDEIEACHAGLNSTYPNLWSIEACMLEQSIWHDNFKTCQRIKAIKSSQIGDWFQSIYTDIELLVPTHLTQCETWETYLINNPGYPNKC